MLPQNGQSERTGSVGGERRDRSRAVGVLGVFRMKRVGHSTSGEAG